MLDKFAASVARMHQRGSEIRGSGSQLLRGLHFSRWLILLLLLLPITASIWFITVTTDPLPIDVWWYNSVSVTPGSALFTLAHALHVIGSTLAMAIIGVALTIFLLTVRRWRAAVSVALTLLGVLVIVAGLKLLVARPRPGGMLVVQGETSFPSGHTLGGAALMTILVCIIVVHTSSRALHWGAMISATVYLTIMIWSRTALHVHWLSDTVCAASLGIALGLTVANAVFRTAVEKV